MKSLTKLTSAVVLLALVLTAFPALGAGTARASACDWAGFVADVTVPDGTFYAPGTVFEKTWRLRNIGTCTWNTNYALVFDSGEKMGAQAAKNLPKTVAPGDTVDVSVTMTAPSSAGHYLSYWKLRNDKNVIFGIGYYANRAFWAEINVRTTPGTSFDFTEKASEATWSSGAGALTFPGIDGDAKGFVLKLDKPKFESGVELANPGLLTAPQNVYNGYIQAVYKPYRVKTGDRFQARIGCEYNATNCYVAYRLDYRIGNGPVRTYWSFREKYEGLTYSVNLNLNPLAGYDVTFILIVSAYGNASGDRALWGHPVITGSGGPVVTITPTATGPTPTPTSTLPPSTSCDRVKFIKDFNYPDGSIVPAGTQFNKTWRLQNVGTCTWTKSYQLAYYSGDKMNGPDSLAFPKEVKPGDIVDITVTLTAPNTAGSYRGFWMFKNARGQLFGIGSQYNKPWWVDIKVTGSSGSTTATHTPTATPTATGTQTTQKVNVRVYFNDINRISTNTPPFQVGVLRAVDSSKYLPEAVLAEYFKGPTTDEQAAGLIAPYNGFTGVSKFELTNGVAHVYLEGTCTASDNTIVDPLMVSLKQFVEIKFVKIYDENGDTANPTGESDSFPTCILNQGA